MLDWSRWVEKGENFLADLKGGLRGDVLIFLLDNVPLIQLIEGKGNLNLDVYLDLDLIQLHSNNLLKQVNLNLNKGDWIFKFSFGILPSIHSRFFDCFGLSYNLIQFKGQLEKWKINSRVQVSLNKVWLNHDRSFFLDKENCSLIYKVSEKNNVWEGILRFNQYKVVNKDGKEAIFRNLPLNKNDENEGEIALKKFLSNEEETLIHDDEEKLYLNIDVSSTT